jgi:hypothetical protein
MTRREAATRLRDATARLVEAGLLIVRPDPFSTDDRDTVIEYAVCEQVEGHANDCTVMARLTKLAQGAA